MNVRRIFAYFPAFARGYVRNPLGLFFALVFPVILILIFGAVFANSSNSVAPLAVQNLDHDSSASQEFLAALNASGAVSLSFVAPNAGNLSTYLSDNSLSSGLVIPAGFGTDLENHTPVRLTVYTNPSTGAEAGIVQGAVAGAANAVNLHLAGGTALVGSRNVNVGSSTYKYIDYLVPGLIGFSILVSPMFSMVNISSTWKRDKLFRQLALTPLTRSEWLTAAMLWYVALAIISAILLLGVGKIVFGAQVTLTVYTLPFLVLGPIMFVALGLLAGSVSSSPESAGVVGNIITFPMMFLSGTFFPTSLFPPWLLVVAKFLPLYYVINGLNAAMIFNDPSAVFANALIVFIVAAVFAVLATRVFRWRED
jgi:ABC-2 type transport system permease protein